MYREIFTDIYETGKWGNNNNVKYNGSSGYGSTIEYNMKYIKFLKRFIVQKNIKTVADIGCGDWRFSPLIYENLDINYIGYDVYNKMIEANKKTYKGYNFYYLDVVNEYEKIFGGDLCVIKDVLQHWKLNDIYNFLDNIVDKFKYILIINCCYDAVDDSDIDVGGWRALSVNKYPLKKYKGEILGYYDTKEISLISKYKK